MKKTFNFLSITIILTSFVSCNNSNKPKNNKINPQFMVIGGGKDTINYIDSNNLRQGRWIYFEATSENTTSYHRSSDEQKIEGDPTNTQFADQRIPKRLEEGYYKDDKKIGFWKQYGPDGKIKDSIKYNNDLIVK